MRTAILAAKVKTPICATRAEPASRASAAGGQRGFTLVELLVVFALLALVIGLVPVAFERVREAAQYRDTVRAMLAEIRQARQRALTEGREVRFVVDPQRRTFGEDGRPPRNVPANLGLRTTVASIESSAERGAAIRFLPDGGATGGSIDIVRPSGSGVRLRVDWLSGQVSQLPLVP